MQDQGRVATRLLGIILVMSEPKPTAVTPMLRIFDVQKALDFYVGFLGFAVDWEHRFGDDFPLYMQVSRGGVALHLTEHHGDACPGSHIFITTTDIAQYHKDITAKGYSFSRPGLDTPPWDENAKVIDVSDPFGNRITFTDKSFASQ